MIDYKKIGDELKKHFNSIELQQRDIADKLGVTQQAIGALLNGKPFGKKTASTWENVFGIKSSWLLTGEGEMLKPGTTQKIGTIHSNHGVVAQVGGDFHNDAGKDQLIDEQKKEVGLMFETLLAELHGFHDISKRRDEYVTKQDAYIADIVKHSYLRNQANMERIDANMCRIDKLIEQQNTLIAMIDRQGEKTQERADRLLDLLEKKL
jgi:transcriptional regulator with XRE-family HTH domain